MQNKHMTTIFIISNERQADGYLERRYMIYIYIDEHMIDKLIKYKFILQYSTYIINYPYPSLNLRHGLVIQLHSLMWM